MAKPKLSWIVLGVVVVLWGGFRWQAHRRGSVLTPIQGPLIELKPHNQGAWDLNWPEWPTPRERPYVAVFGRPFTAFGAHYDPAVFLRVHPSDAIEPGPARPLDAEGWFEAGEDHDFDTVAWLEPGRVSRIEWKVGPSAAGDAGVAVLQIRGIGDLWAWKDIVVSTGIADGMAALAAFLLLIWFLVTRGVRAKRARRGSG